MERKGTDLAEVREQDEQLAYGQGLSQPQNEGRMRVILAVFAALVALVSFFALGSLFTKPDTFAGVMETLDQKKNSVMSLMGASTGSSAAISLLPGDAGTPIAEKLVDLSSDFLIVLAAIYLEKYLLTILGFAAFKVLVPVSCALLVLAVVVWRQPRARILILRIAMKMALFGLAAFLVVPVSVQVSSMIEGTYEASINETLAAAEQTTAAIEESAEEGKSTDTANPLAFLTNMPEELNKLTQSAQDSLSNFIEALAVMIVTSCIIPILVLVFFLWLVKMILGINIDVPYPPLRHYRRH